MDILDFSPEAFEAIYFDAIQRIIVDDQPLLSISVFKNASSSDEISWDDPTLMQQAIYLSNLFCLHQYDQLLFERVVCFGDKQLVSFPMEQEEQVLMALSDVLGDLTEEETIILKRNANYLEQSTQLSSSIKYHLFCYVLSSGIQKNEGKYFFELYPLAFTEYLARHSSGRIYDYSETYQSYAIHQLVIRTMQKRVSTSINTDDRTLKTAKIKEKLFLEQQKKIIA